MVVNSFFQLSNLWTAYNSCQSCQQLVTAAKAANNLELLSKLSTADISQLVVIFRLVDLVKAVNSWVRSATGNVFQRIEVHLVIQMYFSLERAETSVETFVLIIRRHLGELLTLAQALDREAYTKNHIDLHVLFDLVYKVQGFESFFFTTTWAICLIVPILVLSK